jgi:hypothetical protein
MKTAARVLLLAAFGAAPAREDAMRDILRDVGRPRPAPNRRPRVLVDDGHGNDI